MSVDAAALAGVRDEAGRIVASVVLRKAIFRGELPAPACVWELTTRGFKRMLLLF